MKLEKSEKAYTDQESQYYQEAAESEEDTKILKNTFEATLDGFRHKLDSLSKNLSYAIAEREATENRLEAVKRTFFDQYGLTMDSWQDSREDPARHPPSSNPYGYGFFTIRSGLLGEVTALNCEIHKLHGSLAAESCEDRRGNQQPRPANRRYTNNTRC